MMGHGVSRQLRAVIYTSGWSSDEGVLSEFGGRLIGTRDRGILATFASCHNAMLALARAGERTRFAAGLAFGEVAIEHGDGFGRAIVEAARLAAVCPTGTVLCTDLAGRQLAEFDPEPLGPIELKGIGTVDHHGLDIGRVENLAIELHPIERCQVAVLSTDIVASTELLGTAGTEVAVEVRQVFDDALAAACGRGTVRHVRGDGAVVEFPSATDAVRAAVAMHQFVDAQGLRADGTPFALRSGVAVGPDPETEAVELESTGRPGRIILGEDVHTIAFDLADDITEGSLRPMPPEAAPYPTELSVGDALPLVGRVEALDGLEACWQDACEGQPSAVFVTGEAGIGKTRLVSEFARARHREGALVLFGSSGMEMTAPYRAFADALAPVLDQGHSSVSAARLRPLFPDDRRFGDDRPDLPVDSEAGTADRFELFEAVREALGVSSRVRPVLLILDDLHWVSRDAALLLGHLLRHRPTGRVLILGTYRDAEVDRTHPLFDVVNDQEVIQRTRRVSLANLDVGEVADLIGAHFQTTVGEAERRLAHRIHRESSGLPFFTGEVLRHLGEPDGQAGIDDAADRLGVPATLVDAVQQRLGRLDDDTCRMLETAATAGLTFDVGVLVATLGVPLDDLVGQLEAAQRLALVHESGRAGRYQFEHALVRSALLTGLSATRVAMIHQQIAVALETLPGDHNDSLAHHWRHASGPTARRHAVRHLVLAADRDAGALAWEAAKARYEEALDLAGDDHVIDRETVVSIRLARARSMRASGDPEYLEAMQVTGRLARAAGLGDVIAQVAVGSTKPGTWFANANEPDDHLIGLCEDALAWPDLDPTLRCRVLSTLATNLAFDDDRARRRAVVDEAIEIARSVGTPDLIASALIASHLAFWDPSTLAERVDIIDELERIARRRDNPDHLFLSGFFRASMLLECGRLTEARAALTQLDEPIARTHSFWFRFLVDRMETAIAVAGADPDAKARVDALFETSFETQADAAGTWGAQLGGLAIQNGTFGSMADQLAAGAERSRGQGVWSCALAIAQLDQGDADGARATLEGLRRPPLDFMWLVAKQMIAEAAFRLGDRDRCAEVLEELRPFAGRVGVVASGTLVFGLVSTSIGEAALGVGQTELAIESFRAAARQAEQLDLPFFRVRSHRRLLEASPASDWTPADDAVLDVARRHGFESELSALCALRDRRH